MQQWYSDILVLHTGNQLSNIFWDRKWNSLTFPDFSNSLTFQCEHRIGQIGGDLPSQSLAYNWRTKPNTTKTTNAMTEIDIWRLKSSGKNESQKGSGMSKHRQAAVKRAARPYHRQPFHRRNAQKTPKHNDDMSHLTPLINSYVVCQYFIRSVVSSSVTRTLQYLNIPGK